MHLVRVGGLSLRASESIRGWKAVGRASPCGDAMHLVRVGGLSAERLPAANLFAGTERRVQRGARRARDG